MTREYRFSESTKNSGIQSEDWSAIRRRLFICLIIVFAISIQSAVASTTYTWTGSVNSNWNNPSNWAPSSGYPVASDAVNIPATTNKPTVNVASACSSITITGTTTLTVSAALTVSSGLTINSSNTLTTAGTSTVTFGGSSSISGTLITGPGNNIDFNSSLTVNNGGSFTNNSTGTNSINFKGSSFTLSGGSSFTNSGKLAISNSGTFTTGNPVTLTNSSGATISISGSNVNFNGGTTINNSGTITAGSSTITAGNPVPISNSTTGTISLTATSLNLQGGSNITNSGAISALSGSTISFGNPSYINNTTSASSLTLTGSTLNIGAGGYITNTGTITSSASSAISLNGNPTSLTNNAGSTLTASATTFTMVAGSTITNTGAAFTAISSPFNVSGNPTSITNQPSGTIMGYMTFDNCAITFNGSNSLNNYGAITAYNGTSINMTSSGSLSSINNYGTFYAGTSNSPCTITLTGSQSRINNSNTTLSGVPYYGYFFLGSTSVINLTSLLGSVNNSTSCTFTLMSDAYGSATLSAIGALSGGYSGTFNVQRYITGGSPTYRSYRLFSSPVYSGNDVYGNKIYSLNYVQASALVTGTGSGFDKTGNPSLYLYRENIAYSNATFVSGNFRGVASIASAPSYTINGDAGNFNIPVGNGFLFFFRGDRTSNLANKYTPGTSAESVTMTATGTLNQGQYIVHNWYTPLSARLGYTTTAGNSAVMGDNLVGNPYASSIDWENLQSSSTVTGIYGSGIGTTMYLLDPVSHNYGAYTKGGGGIGTNHATNIIASGQGFFITASSSSAQLIFNESAKTNNQVTGSHLLMGTPDNGNAIAGYMRLQLAKDSVDTDDMLLRFSNGASTAYKPDVDAPYKPGFGAVSFCSLSSDKVLLAINEQTLPKISESIALSINTKTDGVYSINVQDIKGIPQLFDIWLMDRYAKDSLDMRHNSVYSFNVIKSDSASFGTGRFALVIRQNPAYAYQLLDFKATKATSGKQVLLVWKAENEDNYTHFTVERSIDNGQTYEVVGGLTGSNEGTYSLADKNPSDKNLYRLRSEDFNDSITYSKVIPIAYSNLSNNLAKHNISLYPNPAKSTINLSVTGTDTATGYNILITNSSGLLIKQAISAQSGWQSSVSDLMPGTYIIKVYNNKDQSFIGNAKFVKL